MVSRRNVKRKEFKVKSKRGSSRSSNTSFLQKCKFV